MGGRHGIHIPPGMAQTLFEKVLNERKVAWNDKENWKYTRPSGVNTTAVSKSEHGKGKGKKRLKRGRKGAGGSEKMDESLGMKDVGGKRAATQPCILPRGFAHWPGNQTSEACRGESRGTCLHSSTARKHAHFMDARGQHSFEKE